MRGLHKSDVGCICTCARAHLLRTMVPLARSSLADQGVILVYNSPKITFDCTYDVTIRRHVVERNLAFGVKNRCIDLKFCAVVGVG